MKPLAWIRLFAYRERSSFQDRRERDHENARLARVRQGRLMAELRLAITRALESHLDDRPARTLLALSSDGTDHGFFVEVGAGRTSSAMRVTLSGHGVECAYALGNGVASQLPSPDVRVVFHGARLLPATVAGQRETRTFESMKSLGAHLLQPLLADAPSGTRAAR